MWGAPTTLTLLSAAGGTEPTRHPGPAAAGAPAARGAAAAGAAAGSGAGSGAGRWSSTDTLMLPCAPGTLGVAVTSS